MTWTCLCGASNEGYFCGQCGQKYGIAAEEQQTRYRRGSENHFRWLIAAGIPVVIVVIIMLSIASQSTRQASHVPSVVPAIVADQPSKQTSEPTPTPSLVKDSQNVTEPSPDMAAVRATVAREQQESVSRQTNAKSPTEQITESERVRHTKQRRYHADLIAAAQGILAAQSLEESVGIYCRFTVDQTEALFGTNPNPQLQAYTHNANIGRCKAAIFTGYTPMPDPQFFVEKSAKARQDMADIDQKLGAPAQLPDAGAVAKWEQECRQWQENKLSTLTQLPHGEVTRIMSSAGSQECGLSAEITDRSGTHRLTFMRPGQRLDHR